MSHRNGWSGRDRHHKRRRGQVVCYGCGRPGHHIRDCRNPRQQQGGYKRKYRGDADPRSKHVKTEAPLSKEERLRSLIVRIGEASQSSIEENLSLLADALHEDLGQHCNFIIDSLLECTSQLPTKTGIYATLVGLLNARNHDFGARLVKRYSDELENCVDKGLLRSFKLLLQFGAELVNTRVLVGSSFMSLAMQLADFVASSSDQSAAAQDSLAMLLVTLLPRFTTDFFNASKVAQLRSTLADYVPAREEELKNPDSITHVVAAKHAQMEESVLSLAARVLADCKEPDDFKSAALVRPFGHFEEQLSKAEQHTFTVPQLSAERLSRLSPQTLRIRSLLRLFKADHGLPLVDGALDRLLLSEYVVDLLHFFQADAKLCAEQILTLQTSDDIRTVVMETIFSGLLQLPVAEFPVLYIGTVVIELFKAAPKQFPRVFGRAIHELFQVVPFLDVECVDRLVQFFARHLSNFKFQFAWKAWDQVLAQDDIHPQRVFVEEVLRKSVLLSYWDRVQQSLPTDFHSLLPARPVAALKYLDKADAKPAAMEVDAEDAKEPQTDDPNLNTESTEDAKLSARLLELFKSRADAAKVLDELQGTDATAMQLDDAADQAGAPSDALSDDKKISLLKVFVPSLLYAGSKSYSHVVSLLDRHKSTLVYLGGGSAGQAAMIEAVAEFWQTSAQHVVVLVDKMYSLKILEAQTVVEWVFRQRNMYNSLYLWQVLQGIVDNTVARVQRALTELKASTSVPDSADDETRQAAEEKLTQGTQGLNGLVKDLCLSVFREFQQQLEHPNFNDQSLDDDEDEEDETRLLAREEARKQQQDILRQRFLQFARKNIGIVKPFLADVAPVFEQGAGGLHTAAVFKELGQLVGC